MPKNDLIALAVKDERFLARFWSRVDKSGECWVWTGPVGRKWGYGIVHIPYSLVGAGNINTVAHRISWAIANGRLPDGLCVCHACDNPPCVNPAHLWLGTDTENAADRDRKGRNINKRGTDHWKASITEEIAIDIMRRHRAGERNREIAAHHGISKSIVTNVVNLVSWKHLFQ